MLRGIAYVVAHRGENDECTETTVCLEISGEFRRLFTRLLKSIARKTKWRSGCDGISANLEEQERGGGEER